MDIEFLLFLQQLREATFGLLDGFFLQLSVLAEPFYALAIMSVVYWCLDKALGMYVLLGWGLNRLGNGFLKITACVYRPWIRDPRVQPLDAAIEKATGYSFPSGHTTNAVSMYGGPALRRGVGHVMRLVLVALTLLTGLSRNWVGVHTPQDVIVALLVGCGSMLLMGWVVDKVDERPDLDVVVAAIGIAASIALIAYAALKTYPIDYDAAGEVLVDPQKMANDSFKNAGWALGVSIGWLCERRFVRFTTDASRELLLQRCLVGLIAFSLVYYPVTDLMKLLVPGGVGSSLGCFLQTLTIVWLVPAATTWWERRHAADFQSGRQAGESAPEVGTAC